jgi:hypothetical protein
MPLVLASDKHCRSVHIIFLWLCRTKAFSLSSWVKTSPTKSEARIAALGASPDDSQGAGEANS